MNAVPKRVPLAILRAEDEGQDADVNRTQGTESRHDQEAPLDSRGEWPRQNEKPERDPAQEERERQEVAPAHNVLRDRRPRCAEGVRGRRCGDADAEREQARADVAVMRQYLPANRVGTSNETLQRRLDRAGVRHQVRRLGDHTPARRVNAHGERDGLDRLAEHEPDDARRAVDALAEGRNRLQQRCVC